MRKPPLKKFRKLKKTIKEMGSLLLAYSGGLDSSFLLKVSSEVLKNRVIAVTARSLTYPLRELRNAQAFCRKLGVRHIIIETRELEDINFRKNSLKRCYYCKRELFSRLKELARRYRVNYVADGSNLDDENDFRPGLMAKEELGVRSPLKEAGLKKEEIRVLAKYLGLSFWDKPPFACYSSRFPYYTEITPERLLRVDKIENFLINLGFKQVRARDHNNLLRLEVFKEDIPFLLSRYRERILRYARRLGYTYITVDLQGYRTGSMNEVIGKNDAD